jgi:putative acetyltransferase
MAFFLSLQGEPEYNLKHKPRYTHGALMTDTFHISRVTESDPNVDQVLQRHHDLMRSLSPEESCHVMNADELRASGAQLFALYQDGKIQGVGAFKALTDTSVELKSMHVLFEARGHGYGKNILTHLLDEAQKAGAQTAYLETGSEAPFAAARALYESLGFLYVGPFGDYIEDPLSVFMSLTL